MITVLVTDAQLNVAGDPILCWTSVECTLRHNTVGSGSVTVPGYGWIREQLLPGHRIVVVRNGSVFAAGPIEHVQRQRASTGDNAGPGRVTVAFADDLSLIASRLAYPDPAQTAEDQTTDQWTYTGNAELALLALVNANAGPGARPERRVPRLVMAAPTGVGSIVEARAERMEPLLDVARRVAAVGGGLGFRTRQIGKDIRFEVFAPRDLSKVVRFGFGLGNLTELTYEVEAPKATTAIVGGQGEGADRYMITRTVTGPETAWGRRETHVGRAGSAHVDELAEAGDEALAEAAETARLETVAWDSPDQAYGVHFGLGDRVSIQIEPGEEVTDLVRQVVLRATPGEGETVAVTVGTQEASQDQRVIAHLRAIERRLGRIERQ